MARKLTTKIGGAVCCALLGIGSTAYAAQDQGSSEIEGTGGFTHAEGTNSGVLNANVSYGYFFTPNIEVGVRQTLTYNFNNSQTDDTWQASTVPFVNYQFRGLSAEDRFQPFVGAFIGATYNDKDTTGTIGPQLGVKYFVNDSTFVVARYSYGWLFNDITLGDSGPFGDNKSSGNHAVNVGLGYTWK
jgi:outer membrane protein W